MNILFAAIGLAVGLAIGVVIGIIYRKRVAEKEIAGAEEESKRIVNNAIKEAESKKRESLLAAKEEILKDRTELDHEIKERRKDIVAQERNLQSKESKLDRKQDLLEEKDEQYNQKLKDVEALKAEADKMKQAQMEMLERISGMTAEQAKVHLMDNLETELTRASAVKVKEFEQRTREESDTKAREIIGAAIQRCASDHVTEATVSVVVLPSDEMKGRIIGREGRNIRAMEALTGVDMIIDDTPEAITLSSFDPVRREIARVAL